MKPLITKFRLSHFHLIFGLLLLITFLLTGRYMRFDFPDKEIIAPEFRILMRSRHIYILLASLIHIMLGVYLQSFQKSWQKALQLSGSFLLTAGSILLVWAFFHETYTIGNFSNFSRYGLYLSLAGTIFHLISKVLNGKNESSNSI